MIEKSPWQKLLKETGISQADLARATGWYPATVHRHLTGHPRGTPKFVKALILALRALPPEKRAAWLAEAIAEQAAENDGQEQDDT
jgi:hypothetical protein